MKSDREKLIELINESEILCDSCGESSSSYCAEAIADHILADGWIKPPCKPVDKVYIISRNKVKECKVVFVGISGNEMASYFVFVEYDADGNFRASYSITFDKIGTIVFLSREDAEKALKGVE